jgi:hypothetical protein
MIELFLIALGSIALLLKQSFKRRHMMSIKKKLIVVSTALVLSVSAVNSAVATPEHGVVPSTEHLPSFLTNTGAKKMSENAMKEVHGEFGLPDFVQDLGTSLVREVVTRTVGNATRLAAGVVREVARGVIRPAPRNAYSRTNRHVRYISYRPRPAPRRTNLVYRVRH